MTHRQIKQTIHLPYKDVAILEKILRDVNIFLQNHPDLDKTRRLAAYFSEFGPFSIKMVLYAFTYETDWQ